MFSTFDLRLLLYVIRLAGWLKHCNLSLSLARAMQQPTTDSDCKSAVVERAAQNLTRLHQDIYFSVLAHCARPYQLLQ